jgi:hypothetical protein
MGRIAEQVQENDVHSFLPFGHTVAHMQCRFSVCCKYHDWKDSRCQDNQNAASSCAAAWQFDRYAKGDRDIGMNVANIFIVRIHNG